MLEAPWPPPTWNEEDMRRGKPKQRHSCAGKTPWASKKLAQGAMFGLVRAGANLGRLGVYRCSFCWITVGKQQQRPWHVGHKMRGAT